MIASSPHFSSAVFRPSSTQEGIDTDVPIEGGSGNETRMARTPLNIKTPLGGRRHLVHNLRRYNRHGCSHIRSEKVGNTECSFTISPNLPTAHIHSPLYRTHPLTSPPHTSTHLSTTHIHSPLHHTHPLTSPPHTSTHLSTTHIHSPLHHTHPLTSPPYSSEFGFQQKMLLSLPALSSSSESWGHQAMDRMPFSCFSNILTGEAANLRSHN